MKNRNTREEILENIQRIVVKVGTSTLTNENGHLDIEKIRKIVLELSNLQDKGYDVILVSSGAVGAGMGLLNINEKPKTFTMEGTKQVFYLTPGKHTITSSFQKSRPGILSKRVITEYEPTTQEVEVEAEKTYIYSFDKKNEQYTFTEKN